MSNISDIDESRRLLLLRLLTSGALALTLPGCVSKSSAYRSDELPAELPPGRSIYDLDGSARVNGVQATLQTPIVPGDVVETGDSSYIIFVLNRDAFILRANSQLQLPGGPSGAATRRSTFQLNEGKMLSVLASRQSTIRTPIAVMGIRGTGLYIETDPEKSYVCTCYGAVDLSAADNPTIKESVVTEHHDAPRYIIADSTSSNRIQPAPFVNHDDEELLLIETLVGRTTPYVVPRSVTRTRPRFY